MSGMEIGSALLLVMMLVWMWPRAKHWINNSPDAKPGDWASFAMVALGVGAFVAFLMSMV